MKSTVFLGGGRITAALLSGLQLAEYPGPILVFDRHSEKLRQLKRRYGIAVERNLHRAVAQAGLLIVAVRPSSVADLLKEIGALNRALPAVSLAAGIPLAKLQARLGSPVRWARAMPSPLCRRRQGLTALAFSRGFPAKRAVKTLFGKVGMTIEIAEPKFDIFTVSYSPSHGYHALATLAQSAEQLGLNRKIALTAAAHALADAIVNWREGDLSLEELLREAATPGGTAAAVMDAMDRAGYRSALTRGLAAGVKRAQKNAMRA